MSLIFESDFRIESDWLIRKPHTIGSGLRCLLGMALYVDLEHTVVLGQLIGRPRRELTLTGELNLTFTDPGVPHLQRTELPCLNPRLQNGGLTSTPAVPTDF